MIITSNRTRELHDALKRRCLYHWIDFPDLEREVRDHPASRTGRLREARALGRDGGRAAARARPDQAARRGRGDRLGAGALDPRRRHRSSDGAASATLGWAVKNHDDLRRVESPCPSSCTTDVAGARGRRGAPRRLRPRPPRRGDGRRNRSDPRLLPRGGAPSARGPLLGGPRHAGREAGRDPRLRPRLPLVLRGRRCPAPVDVPQPPVKLRSAELPAVGGGRGRRAEDRAGAAAREHDRDAEGEELRALLARGAGRAGGAHGARQARRAACGGRAVAASRSPGAPDLRRTIRRSFRTGGEPIERSWTRAAPPAPAARALPRRLGVDGLVLARAARLRPRGAAGRPALGGVLLRDAPDAADPRALLDEPGRGARARRLRGLRLGRRHADRRVAEELPR